MSAEHRTVLAAFSDAVGRHGPQPLLTWYDGSTGERVELSAATADSWVTKVANLVSDELLVDPGSTAHVALPPHWQTVVSALGCWAAGLTLTADATADLAVVGPPQAHDPDTVRSEHVLASALLPLGGAFTEPLPAGWLDFATDVPPQPDEIVAPVPVRPEDPAVVGGQEVVSHGDLVEQVRALAEAVSWTPGARALVHGDLANLGADRGFDVLRLALVAVVENGSVVLGNGLDEQTLPVVVEQEGVTLTLDA